MIVFLCSKILYVPALSERKRNLGRFHALCFFASPSIFHERERAPQPNNKQRMRPDRHGQTVGPSPHLEKEIPPVVRDDTEAEPSASRSHRLEQRSPMRLLILSW